MEGLRGDPGGRGGGSGAVVAVPYLEAHQDAEVPGGHVLDLVQHVKVPPSRGRAGVCRGALGRAWLKGELSPPPAPGGLGTGMGTVLTLLAPGGRWGPEGARAGLASWQRGEAMGGSVLCRVCHGNLAAASWGCGDTARPPPQGSGPLGAAPGGRSVRWWGPQCPRGNCSTP